MKNVQEELCQYAHRTAARGLTAGAGGNISVRDEGHCWIKPSGFAMEDLSPADFVSLDLGSGKCAADGPRPSSEWPMHLALYRARPDIQAIFHVHSPWACGVISSGCAFRPMFPEVVADLGGMIQLPYLLTGSEELAQRVAEAAVDHETIFLSNHGIVALGQSIRQAYYRCCVVEDAAKSLVAASIVGKPQFLSDEQVEELMTLEAGPYRAAVAGGR
jgi:L-fuculose-phosphate aldolase